MKTKILTVLLLGIICLWIVILPNVVMAQADKIYQENNKAVVVVLTYDKEDKPLVQGSGFIVRSDGAIVTNLHVVSQAASIKVKIAKDKHLEVEGVLYTDKVNDLVILKADGKNLSILKLGDSDKIKPGEKVYVIGSPAGLENTITDGIISGIREPSQNQKVIQISTPISQGSSGGPVFNERGKVIGVATFILKDAQNLNFAMPVNLIRTKINNRRVLPLEKIITPNYKDTAEYWFWQGYYLDDAGKHKEAIESYKEAIRIKPDYAGAHYCLGLAYAGLEDYKKAIESYKETIRIKPDYAWAHCNLGGAYAKLGDYKKAIESLKQAIRIMPDYAGAHYCLGLAYGELWDYQKAIECYKQAIRIKPNDAEMHYCLGCAYMASGMTTAMKSDIQKAIESFKQAIRLQPNDAEAYRGLGLCYTYGMALDKQRAQKAIESLKELVRLKPNDAGGHFVLGMSYLSLGDRSSALEEYKILKDLDKELANELFNLIYGKEK